MSPVGFSPPLEDHDGAPGKFTELWTGSLGVRSWVLSFCAGSQVLFAMSIKMHHHRLCHLMRGEGVGKPRLAQKVATLLTEDSLLWWLASWKSGACLFGGLLKAVYTLNLLKRVENVNAFVFTWAFFSQIQLQRNTRYLLFPVYSQKTLLLDPCNIFPILSSDKRLIPSEGTQFKTKPLVDSLNSNPSTSQCPGPTGGGHPVCQELCERLGWGARYSATEQLEKWQERASCSRQGPAIVHGLTQVSGEDEEG